MVRSPHARPLLLFLFVLALVSVSLAQDVTGTITARMEGEQRTWNTLGFESEDGFQSTASWSVVMDPMVAISIQGSPETGFQVEETLSLELTSFDGFPTDCPCRLPQAEVMYWTTSSMLEDVYVGTDADVSFTAVEPLENDAYRVEGTFSATLTFQPRIGAPPEEGDTLDVEGTFVVESLPQLVIE